MAFFEMVSSGGTIDLKSAKCVAVSNTASPRVITLPKTSNVQYLLGIAANNTVNVGDTINTSMLSPCIGFIDLNNSGAMSSYVATMYAPTKSGNTISIPAISTGYSAILFEL